MSKKELMHALRLLEKHVVIDENVKWWEKEMKKLDAELDLLPLIADEEERDKKAAELEKRLDELSARGLHEIANIRDWHEDFERFKNEK